MDTVIRNFADRLVRAVSPDRNGTSLNIVLSQFDKSDRSSPYLWSALSLLLRFTQDLDYLSSYRDVKGDLFLARTLFHPAVPSRWEFTRGLYTLRIPVIPQEIRKEVVSFIRPTAQTESETLARLRVRFPDLNMLTDQELQETVLEGI